MNHSFKFSLTASRFNQMAAAAIALFSAGLHAQTAPLPNTPVSPASAASAVVSGSTTQGKFVLNEVRFNPTRAVSASELQALVRPFLKREIDATELTVMASAIRRAYEERGFGMAGVGFPTQDLTRGVLQIAIVEPQVLRVEVESGAKPPVSADRVTRVLERNGIRAGEALDLPALDRAMFTLNDWPGVQAKTTLMPNGDEGQYKVMVQTERRRAWDANIDADNYGSSVSGRNRVGATLRWNNPTGIGDNLDLRAMASNGKGTTVGRIGYEAPLGASPWRGGLGYSRVGYQLGEQFEGLGAVGSAHVLDASVSYPFVRERERNLVGRLSVVNKKLSDEITATRKTIRGLELSTSFESRSHWMAGGFNGGSMALQWGQLSDQSGTGANSAPADPTTVGGFAKFTLQLSRLQALTRTVSLFVGAAAQWANKNLDNAEKFTLGGDKGVRAYPAAEGSSDEGGLLNTELRYWISPQWSSYLFYDVGRGRTRKTPDALTGENLRTLQGRGIGVQFTDPDWFTLKASLGVRGSEPVLSESGQSRTRLLVQVQHSF